MKFSLEAESMQCQTRAGTLPCRWTSMSSMVTSPTYLSSLLYVNKRMLSVAAINTAKRNLESTSDYAFLIPNTQRMRSSPNVILRDAGHCKYVVVVFQSFHTNVILRQIRILMKHEARASESQMRIW